MSVLYQRLIVTAVINIHEIEVMFQLTSPTIHILCFRTHNLGYFYK